MKTVLFLVMLMMTTACAHAHRTTHVHTPKAPDSVKAACAVKAEYPRKCVQRWKNNHAYSHAHAHGHSHGEAHAHHAHGGKAKVKVGVVVPLN